MGAARCFRRRQKCPVSITGPAGSATGRRRPCSAILKQVRRKVLTRTRPSPCRLPAGVLVAVVVFGPAPRGLHSQPPGLAPDPENLPLQEILDRMSRNNAARQQELKSYTAIRHYHLHNGRFHTTADLTVRMNYRYPGEKDFQVLAESGPRLVGQRVLRRMAESEVDASRDAMRRLNQITPANYDFRLLRLDRTGGRPAYVLEALPKGKSQYLVRGQVWVDAEDFAVARIVGEPAKSPSFWIRRSQFVYRYGKFGPFWLPLSTDSEADALLFGHTEVTIRSRDYQINAFPAGPSGDQ